MKIIYIITQAKVFEVNEADQITYASWTHASDTWKLMGAVEFRFGRVCKTYTPEDVREGRVPWFYKNGKQRCHIKDYDHGTYRVWMSPGLMDVRVVNREERRAG